MRTNTLENIRKMVIRKIWVKAMGAALALAAALNACSSNGSNDNSFCSINGSTVQIENDPLHSISLGVTTNKPAKFRVPRYSAWKTNGKGDSL